MTTIVDRQRTRSARLSATSLAAVALVAGCAASPAVSEIRRVPWSSTDALIARVAAWPPATSAEAPWAFEVLVPRDLDQAEFERVDAALQDRGYEAALTIPSLIGELRSFEVRLVLADPVTLHVETLRVAETLWGAGIPFGTTAGSSLWLILPRRAIPSARSALAGIAPDSAWHEF